MDASLDRGIGSETANDQGHDELADGLPRPPAHAVRLRMGAFGDIGTQGSKLPPLMEPSRNKGIANGNRLS